MVSEGFPMAPHFGTLAISRTSVAYDAETTMSMPDFAAFNSSHGTQRLHIVGGTTEAAERKPITEQFAMVLETGLQAGFVDSVCCGSQDRRSSVTGLTELLASKKCRTTSICNPFTPLLISALRSSAGPSMLAGSERS
jgi:hypothetical protein